MTVHIWNHSVVEADSFVTPWQASIDAVDLSHEVGTGEDRPSCTLVNCCKRVHQHSVRFSKLVDLFVGDETDHTMTWWPHLIGVPHHQAMALQFSLPPDLPHPSTLRADSVVLDGCEDFDESSLLAAHTPPAQQGPVVLPPNGPDDALMDNRDVARDLDDPGDPDDPQSPSEGYSPDLSEITAAEAWYSTLIYTIDGGPSSLWLDWSDFYEMYRRTAQHLRMHVNDLHFLYWIAAPPADTRRANACSVIAHRRGDLPAGSTDRFVLLDIEFHAAIPLTTPEVVRKVRLLPEHISREQLLRGIGLYPYCRRAQNRCLIWLNNNLVALGTNRISP